MEPLQAGDPPSVGVYRLLGRLGAGGMGRVYLGVSPGGRKVAVKVVLPEHSASKEFRQRFAREVAAARQVGGFHTAPVVDADPDADPPWMVTAYISGPSLDDMVRNGGPLDPPALGALGPALAEGLAAVHAAGLVHRDLKPGNVIMAEDGPRIIDFGIARAVDATAQTTSGVLIGTFSFMSPEQVRGERLGPESDIFSLGSVLAYAATGHGPFDANNVPAIIHRIATEAPDLEPLTGSLRDAISACLAKDPRDRPTLDQLLSFLSGVPGQLPGTWQQGVSSSPSIPPLGATFPPRPPAQAPGRRFPMRWAAALGGTVLVVLAVALGILVPGHDGTDKHAGGTGASSTIQPSSPQQSASTSAGGSTVSCTYTPANDGAGSASLPPAKANTAASYTAILRTNRGNITIRLLNSRAPCTVNSFIHLAETGFWDNTQCHRVSDSGGLYMLQCGDPTAKANETLACSGANSAGTGGPGYSFGDENLAGATYRAGTVAMANAGPNTNGSQFFLVFKDIPGLSSAYTPFGTISSGLAILQSVANAGTTCTFPGGVGGGVPKEQVDIIGVTITKP